MPTPCPFRDHRSHSGSAPSPAMVELYGTEHDGRGPCTMCDGSGWVADGFVGYRSGDEVEPIDASAVEDLQIQMAALAHRIGTDKAFREKFNEFKPSDEQIEAVLDDRFTIDFASPEAIAANEAAGAPCDIEDDVFVGDDYSAEDEIMADEEPSISWDSICNT